MRIITDGEQFGFQTEPSDAELASATRDALDSSLALLGHFSKDGECDRCNDKARLRELATKDDDGEFSSALVCASCQSELTEAFLEGAADD